MNALSPLGWLYGLGSDLRNKLYDWQFLRSHSLGTKTISIGNLTTGGTGKTPLVAFVARLLSDAGERVCVLTRGYGRADQGRQVLVSDGKNVRVDAREGGDEPVELALLLKGKAAVIADRDRVAAAKWALQNLKSTVFVLDDGFQHRRVARDIDIVCVDATNPFENGKILPAGKLRERPGGLSRADAVIVTRADLIDDLIPINDEISRLAPSASLFRLSNKITRFSELSCFLTAEQTNEHVISGPVFAFCGLGSPASFLKQLEIRGIRLAGTRAFPDHHFFTDKELADLESEALRVGAQALVTTGKDAVRILNWKPEIACYVARIDVEISDNERFRDLIFSS